MHESSVNDTVREVPDPGVVLEECRSKNWNMWLVLDPGCHPQALAKLYATEPDAEKTLLFFDSPLEHMHELSPRIAAVFPESPMLNWLEHHNPPGWGMVLASDAQAGDVLAHLRSLLLVKTEGEDVIFRIWDGRIVSRICKAMPEEIPSLLGPARLVLTCTSEGAWMRIDYESHKADAPRIVHPCPWYMFGARHAEVFRDGRAQVIARNIVFSMYGADPFKPSPQPPGDESLLDFAVRHVERGLAMGLCSEQALDLFVRCCLLHGDSFPNREGQPVIRAFTSQVLNEESAMTAMRTICNQGAHHG
jgi:hypothetical protein